MTNSRMRLFAKLATLVVLVALLLSCSKNPAGPEKNEVVVSKDVVQLSDDTISKIADYDSSTGVLVFSQETADLQKLTSGKVIVLPITEKTPYGFLGRVEDVRTVQGRVRIQTTQATLEDVFEEASIEVGRSITVDDVAGPVRLMKGVRLSRGEGGAFKLTIDDEVCWEVTQGGVTAGASARMTGSLEFKPGFDIDLKIEHSKIQSLSFHSRAEVTSDAEVLAELSLAAENQEGKVIGQFPISPLTIWAGWVPIVITPTLSVKIGGKVEATCGFSTAVKQSASLDAGLEYSDSRWRPVRQFDRQLECDLPHPSGNMDVYGWVGPELYLRLYGVAGPYADVRGFLELVADVLQTPWWHLDAGAKVGVGVRVGCLGKSLADYYEDGVIEYRKTLAEAEGALTGTILGDVRDALTLEPIENVRVKAVLDGTVKAETRTDARGEFSMEVPAGSGYTVHYERQGYLPATYSDITVAGFENVYLGKVLQIDDSHSGPGNVRGTIRDALTGETLSNVTIRLRRGLNTRSGSVVAETSTDSYGVYEFTGISAGNYTAEATKYGYLPAYFTVNIVGGQQNEVQTAALSPVLGSDELRIVLTWGDSPQDLDSHLTGPDGSGSRFHVYYDSPSFYGDNGVSAVLDRDDTDGNGPETITLTGYQEGLFRYSVHDYSDKGITYGSYTLSNSDAVVRVFGADGLLASFHVPAGTEGTLWTVFELLNGQIVPKNIMSYEEDPARVRKASMPPETDAPLMWKLPEKSFVRP